MTQRTTAKLISHPVSHTWPPRGASHADKKRGGTALRLPLAFALLGLASFSLAHHSGAPYDNSKRIEVTGVVQEWMWQNPHAWLKLEAADASGEAVEWNIEATSPNILMRQGWRRSSLNPGDEVTVLIYPLRDGAPGGSLLGARLADGTELGAPPGSGGSGSLTGGASGNGEAGE